MARSNQPHNGNPTAAEVFRVFQDTMMASIAGMKLLLNECADLRAELVTVQALKTNNGVGEFSQRQQSRILELREAAKEMEDLLPSLPCEARAAEQMTHRTSTIATAKATARRRRIKSK